MKIKKGQRLLSIVLAVIMVLTIIPTGVFTMKANALVSGSQIVAEAYRHLGKSYVWGAAGPNSFDCSGLVTYVFKQFGISIPHGTSYYWDNPGKYGTVIQYGSTSSAIPGDLISWSGHVAIYVGSGKIIHALNSKYGVTDRVSADEYCISRNGKLVHDGNYRVLRVYGVGDYIPPDPIPATPGLNINTTNIATNDTVTLSWNGVNYAKKYTLKISGAESREFDVGMATSQTYKLTKGQTYNFQVRATGSSGSSGWSGTKSCTAHDPVTVTFKDYDDTVLQSTSIKWGTSATPPVMKERKGYTFQGWSGGYTNVTSNTTVTALYKINTYTVNFLDKSGKVLKTQKVDYGSDATPPTDTNNPTGYEFFGWENENYKNVYTDASNKIINVQGIYKWFNDDLPVVCQISSAKREPDGYYVNLNLTNYDKAVTRGRAVVTLKTANDKLVDSSESTAFSLARNGTKENIEVYVPCDKAATKVEVLVIDNYSSGVPISEKKTAAVDNALDISDWSSIKPIAEEEDIETRTAYSYRDKIKKTNNTKTLEGYIWDETYVSNVGAWSGWTWDKVTAFTNESTKREVETKWTKKYDNYQHFWLFYHYHTGSNLVRPNWTGDDKGHRLELTYDLPQVGTSSVNNDAGYKPAFYGYYNCDLSGSRIWYKPYWEADNYDRVVSSVWDNQYRYRDTNYVYNFYKWTEWSSWTEEAITANNDREVKTETQYRNINSSAVIENNTGLERTISGNVGASNAGKQLTLYVYGWIGASDFTNQYIGQTTVAADGSYTFNNIKLKMEPTRETGDFTVAVGLEGTTNLIVIDTIPAPIPEYTVNFYDWEGNIISTQTVQEGGHAVLPENPTKEGYDFIGWDDGIMNITEDEDIFPVFRKKEFTIVFVDWMNQVLEVQTLEYGDAIVPPEVDEVKGYNFLGWDMIEDGHILAMENLVITAQYEKKQFSVRFMDMDGNVIRTDPVEYGEDAVPPTLENTDDGKIFVGWANPEDYTNVDDNVYIVPIYYFAETTENPAANHESGEYDSTITLTLTAGSEDDVIFYYLNGDDKTETIYTGPITVDKTCSITYYASCVGKNDSEINTNYYCINTADTPSDWMLYDDIPAEVKANTREYFMETETGFSYKDVIETSDVAQIAQLEADGWILDNTRTTEFSDWQREKITADDAILNLEIETKVTEDDPTGTNYRYEHYVYTNDQGEMEYSPFDSEEHDREYETLIEDDKITDVGMTETDNGLVTTYYKNGISWYRQKKILVEYRSRCDISTYYRWTPYSVNPAESGDEREVRTADMFRYANKNYHIVNMFSNIGEESEVYLIQDNTTLSLNTLDKFEGYNIDGLYYDEDYTNAVANNTAITESCTLYAKYNPKQYTVIFQMQDGSEIDTQTVNYLESAAVPEMYQINGYVFGGWDKDFSCITEDTVITGKYIRESEYARVALNMATAKMYQGSYIELKATITPSNLTHEALEWSTSDTNVALVDDAGVVKAVGAGEATITVTVLSTKEKATCDVTVFADVNNHLILSPNADVGIDSAGYLRGIKGSKIENECSTVAQIKAQFKNEDLVFVNIDDKVLTDDDLVGTGTVIMIKNGDAIVDSIVCVVTGDMDGNGVISNRDIGMFCQHLVNKYQATDAQITAMDANGDGSIGNKDASMFAQYLVGKYTF